MSDSRVSKLSSSLPMPAAESHGGMSAVTPIAAASTIGGLPSSSQGRKFADNKQTLSLLISTHAHGVRERDKRNVLILLLSAPASREGGASMNPLSTTIRNFSRVCGTEFNADLVQHFLEAYPAELQINVRKDLGEPQGRGRVYNGVTFFPIRYPVNAMDAPDWLDDRAVRSLSSASRKLARPLHQEGNAAWGFDLDSCFGHGRGLSDQRLVRYTKPCPGSTTLTFVGPRGARATTFGFVQQTSGRLTTLSTPRWGEPCSA